MNNTFAFVIHPIHPKRDVGRKFPHLARLPTWLIDFLSVFFPPVYISEITGVQSAADGRQVKGWFVACPLTPRMMLALPPQVAYRKIIQTGRMAEKLGAHILGLGAFTSVVGDSGATVANNLRIPVTTGDSYTVAVAVKALTQAAERVGGSLENSSAAVLGASGAIGSLCAELLAPQVSDLTLIGRNSDRLRETEERVRRAGGKNIKSTTDLGRMKDAQLIISATSAVEPIIRPEHLRRGAIVCDVSRPRDVSHQVSSSRPDVFVIEGGMVEVPGQVDFGFDFGFPPGKAYACMAETMALALEGRLESYTIGKEIQLAQVLEIDSMATKHGFEVVGFRSFERAITDSEIEEIRARSRQLLPA